MTVSHLKITSKSNRWLKLCTALYEGKGKSENCFLAEGLKVVQSLFQAQAKLSALLVGEGFEQEVVSFFNLTSSNKHLLKIEIVEEKLWAKFSPHESPVKIIGVFERPNNSINSLKEANELLVLDRIQDPGNMGTLIRTAVASGWQNLACLKGSVDPYSPKVVRASSGAITGLNIFTDITKEALNQSLKEHNFSVVLTSSHATTDLKDVNIQQITKPCLILGNEGGGVNLSLQTENSQLVKIPMQQSSSVESLNVAIAGALLMYKLKGLI